MSQWDDLQMDDVIRKILDIESRKQGHHFGRPFLTPYQIAIDLKDRYPKEFEALGMPLGGKGTGQYDSLAKYIARELSQRIKNKNIIDIEGRFLSCSKFVTFVFEAGNKQIESSPDRSQELSIFRLI